ncbi:GrfA protein [Flagelloscypha sp. PMI_526]|nr:GrfA protein [Flagelloscypha sp. PMI_526]
MNFSNGPAFDPESPLYPASPPLIPPPTQRIAYTTTPYGAPTPGRSNSSFSSEDPSSDSRWSSSAPYSSSASSRPTSGVLTNHDPPYEPDWDRLDETDELSLSEDYDSEDDILNGSAHDDDDLEDESTSAIRLAEDGTGRIVQANGVAVTQLSVEQGTTHLLLGSSPTHGMPAFLTNQLPKISSTLLVLDISANFLDALPPVLAMCSMLEELNIASNPLRVVPVFLADLTNLRVLIADATGINSLPDTLVDLERLHTLSLRRNKMTSLPSWLCLLSALQALYVDGNPFQGPWEALVKPLLAQVPATPLYPPSTPMHPLPSAGGQSSISGADSESDYSEPASANVQTSKFVAQRDEDDTIMPNNARLSRNDPDQVGLVRTRTAPNRAGRPGSRAKSVAPDVGQPLPSSSIRPTGPLADDSGYFGDREVRKMKSAGDLRRPKSAAPSSDYQPPASARPPLQHFPTSASASNLLNTMASSSDLRPGSRFATFTATSMANNSSPPRRTTAQSIWDNISDNGHDIPSAAPSPYPEQKSFIGGSRPDSKGGRWGFLKKMSMGKMKSDQPPTPKVISSPGPTAVAGRVVRRPTDASNPKPLIDTRISTTGALNLAPLAMPKIETVGEEPPSPAVETPLSAHPSGMLSPGLLSPGPPGAPPRSGRRRSFLPIEAPLSIPIPDASPFVAGVTAIGDGEISPGPSRQRTPSPDLEALARREEERVREGYRRALRSVMAYLKDMNDLTISQQAANGAFGRATASEMSREASMTSNGSHSSETSSHLRNPESMSGLRSNASSMADSVGSNEERKWKDDKGKRVMVVREIVHTERTYVKGLQELFDIYIKPSSATVTVITGVSSTKETILPATERKVVFGGLDALISFHKDSFLPALESAAAPLMKKGAEASDDATLSSKVANAVGNMFFKHVAFMRMYSTYINAVQRVKTWTSERAPPPQSLATSPSSSTSQLSSTIIQESSGSSGPQLTSSQRKRIRSYLKRCRMNPRHSQLNLEGYLLLPVQRIPRYRLLLEELVRCTPPMGITAIDPLDRALAEISSLASNMNEGKREAESRRKLVLWQGRIRGKFPSPLVQPHRRLIMDGPLMLTRVVRKAVMTYDSFNAQGDKFMAQVDCLAPELTPRPLVGILCNDLLVLCRDLSEGKDPGSPVDLWAVLRMQTLPQPASIVHGNALRLVDNKAILYFDTPSPSDALNWYRAINLHIPASKS